MSGTVLDVLDTLCHLQLLCKMYFRVINGEPVVQRREATIQGHTASKCLCDPKDHDLSIGVRSRVCGLW